MGRYLGCGLRNIFLTHFWEDGPIRLNYFSNGLTEVLMVGCHSAACGTPKQDLPFGGTECCREFAAWQWVMAVFRYSIPRWLENQARYVHILKTMMVRVLKIPFHGEALKEDLQTKLAAAGDEAQLRLIPRTWVCCFWYSWLVNKHLLVHFPEKWWCMLEVRLAKEAQQTSEEAGCWQVVGK